MEPDTALLFLPAVWRSKRYRVPLAAALLTFVAVFIEQSGYPHYFAPAASCVLLILIVGLRHLRLYQRRTGQAGRQLVRLIPVVLIIILMLRTAAVAAGVSTTPWKYNLLSWCCVSGGGEARANVLAELQAKGGRHLVFVRFGKDFSTFDWVYNPPDIDAAKVAFARDMGIEANQELLDYYPHRKVWLVEPDNKPVRLRPYPGRSHSAP